MRDSDEEKTKHLNHLDLTYNIMMLTSKIYKHYINKKNLYMIMIF